MSLKHKIRWFFSNKKPCINTTRHGHDLERQESFKNFYTLKCKICGSTFTMSFFGLERA